MLVLSRKKNESIVINGDIRIEVLQIKGKQIRLGITAPADMKVLRGELPPRESKDSSSAPNCRSEKSTRIIDCDMRSLVSAVMATT